MAEIYDFIHRDSAAAAASTVLRILNAVRRLAEYPESGRVAPELIAVGVREVLVGNYRVLHEVEGEIVGIVTVRHAARTLTEKDIRPQ
jgi:plasmid stabilization system protein ParE